jgi:hypothetical protein
VGIDGSKDSRGFNDVEPELEHDLFMRDEIEGLIHDRELEAFPDHKDFKKQIFEVDEKLKMLVFPNPNLKRSPDKKWWELIILKKGGPIYVKEIKDLYKIDVDLL